MENVHQVRLEAGEHTVEMFFDRLMVVLMLECVALETQALLNGVNVDALVNVISRLFCTRVSRIYIGRIGSHNEHFVAARDQSLRNLERQDFSPRLVFGEKFMYGK